MRSAPYAVFSTAIGDCAIAWGPRGIIGSSLPERDSQTLHARMRRRFEGSVEAQPTPGIERTIERIQTMLAGGAADLSDLVLDMADVPEFNRRVYEIAREIPAGATMSYGEIAAQLGDVTLARAVGQALGHNPFPPIVPCHRVLSTDGRMHGFSASGGVALKLRMLMIEGWRDAQPMLFD